jgi:hypothetical protein
MGNHAVGKAFAGTFEAIGIEKIDQMSVEELLKALDDVGEKFRNTDAEFDEYDEPDHPFGHALMKIWGQDLPPQPPVDSEIEVNDEWADLWWDAVKEPLRQRYGFW